MNFPQDQISELKQITPFISQASEGGYEYLLLKNIKLPDGCSPSEVDALLCPAPREGYNCRLFFCTKITGGPERNWNGNLRALGQNWYAISWQTGTNLRLVEMLIIHLKALRNS